MIEVRGSFKNTETWLRRLKDKSYLTTLGAKYGQQGVAALSHATPKDSSKTAAAWDYQITNRPGYYSIIWTNTHSEDPGNIPIAVLIQYGHGTRNRGYVQGRDYINPAMRPIFDRIVADMWREVTKR